MARKNSRPEVNRRKFLAGAAVAGAAASTTIANAASPPTGAAKIPSAVRPTAHQVALEANVVTEVKPMAGRAGSDFMVDVIKSLDIEYCYANPGLELPRHPRVADQLRRQHDAGVHHLHARGILRRDGHGYFKIAASR